MVGASLFPELRGPGPRPSRHAIEVTMLRWLLILFGLLAAIVLIIVATGALLPQSHVVARQVRLTRPPAEVFALVSDFARTPTWRPDLTRVEMLPPHGARPVFREYAGGDVVTYEVDLLDPSRRLVIRIADPNLPFGGTWTYDLASRPDGGTELTITERGEVYNPLFRFMSRFVFSHTATIDRYLHALGTRLGDPVTPESVTPTS